MENTEEDSPLDDVAAVPYELEETDEFESVVLPELVPPELPELLFVEPLPLVESPVLVPLPVDPPVEESPVVLPLPVVLPPVVLFPVVVPLPPGLTVPPLTDPDEAATVNW